MSLLDLPKTMEPVAEPLTKTSGLEGAWCFCDLAGSQLKTLKTARMNSMLQTKLQLQPSCPPRFSILPLFIFWLHVIASLRRLGLDAYLLSFQATPVGVFMSCGGVSFFFSPEKNTLPFLTPREEWRVEGQKPTAVGNLRELKPKRLPFLAPYMIPDVIPQKSSRHPGNVVFLKLLIEAQTFVLQQKKRKGKTHQHLALAWVATWSASFSSAYLLFYFESI